MTLPTRGPFFCFLGAGASCAGTGFLGAAAFFLGAAPGSAWAGVAFLGVAGFLAGDSSAVFPETAFLAAGFLAGAGFFTGGVSTAGASSRTDSSRSSRKLRSKSRPRSRSENLVLGVSGISFSKSKLSLFMDYLTSLLSEPSRSSAYVWAGTGAGSSC